MIADAPRPMNLTYPLGTEDDLRRTAWELGSVCLPITMNVRDPDAVSASVEETVNSLGGSVLEIGLGGSARIH